MRPRTTSALTAFAGAIVAAGVLGAPTTAQAAPEATNYPAPPPVVTVGSASVSTGDAVRIAGRSFAAGEPIAISVRYRITLHSAGFNSPFRPRVSGDRTADDDGTFKARVRLTSPGYATIKATGQRSHQSASVTVRVLAWRGVTTFGGDDFFAGTPLGAPGSQPARNFGPFKLSGNETTTTMASGASGADARTYGADVVTGLLGLTALIGSGLMLRRRRTS